MGKRVQAPSPLVDSDSEGSVNEGVDVWFDAGKYTDAVREYHNGTDVVRLTFHDALYLLLRGLRMDPMPDIYDEDDVDVRLVYGMPVAAAVEQHLAYRDVPAEEFLHHMLVTAYVDLEARLLAQHVPIINTSTAFLS